MKMMPGEESYSPEEYVQLLDLVHKAAEEDPGEGREAMDPISGPRAVKILEWAYESLSGIDPRSLTQFESQLLGRLGGKPPTSETVSKQQRNSEYLASVD